MTPEKEPNFFVKEFNWHRGWNWYQTLFTEAESALAVGEASTAYSNASYYPGVARRIARRLPDIKLIYLIRHPVERLVAEFHYRRSRFGARGLIDTAAEDDELIAKSLYSHQIEEYLRYFQREQILVLTTEALAEQPAAVVQEVYDFIGVDPLWRPDDLGRMLNRRDDVRIFSVDGTLGPSGQVLSERATERLLGRLQPDLQRLRKHLGPDFHCWSLA